MSTRNRTTVQTRRDLTKFRLAGVTRFPDATRDETAAVLGIADIDADGNEVVGRSVDLLASDTAELAAVDAALDSVMTAVFSKVDT